jgi:hypothetical protein
MPSYVTLINWTDQGVKNFKDSVDRYEAAQEVMSQRGASFRDIYWTIGHTTSSGSSRRQTTRRQRRPCSRLPDRGTSGRRPCAPSTPPR